MIDNIFYDLSPVGVLNVGSDDSSLDAGTILLITLLTLVSLLPRHEPLVVGAEVIGPNIGDPQMSKLCGHSLLCLPKTPLCQLFYGVSSGGHYQVSSQNIERLKKRKYLVNILIVNFSKYLNKF